MIIIFQVKYIRIRIYILIKLLTEFRNIILINLVENGEKETINFPFILEGRGEREYGNFAQQEKFIEKYLYPK